MFLQVGKMRIYLDNSSTTRQYDEVTDTIYEVSKNEYGNPSSLHHLGVEAESRIKEARSEVLKHFKAGGEVYFTSSGTEADNTAIFGVSDAKKRQGKKIVTTMVEHPAILEPCMKLLENGYDVEFVSVDRNCNVDLEDLKSKLSPDVSLISVMTVNNEVGTIMPINEIKKLRDSICPNAVLHTDAVQALGKIDLQAIDADLISCSAHKIHGPKGVGSLYIKNGIKVSPYLIGGGQEKGFRSATENTPGICGYAKALELSYRDLDGKIKYISELKNMLKEGLISNIPDIVINTPDNSACTVLNVSFLGTRGEVILHTLESEGIYVSTGSACSSNHKNSKGSHVLQAMGLSGEEITGAIRFSLSEFTTKEEIEYTIDKVKEAVLRFRKLGTFR